MWLTFPNLFTCLRIFAAPVVVYELALRHFILAGWIFGAAAFTDLLDGAVARMFGGESTVGGYLDPIADKILLTSVYVGMAASGAVPVWIVAVVLGRDLWILLLAGIALKFTDFRDMKPDVLGKASTFLQIMTAIPVMGAYGYQDTVLMRICDGLMWGIVALAVLSGVNYSRRGLKWLEERKRLRGNAVDLAHGSE